MCGGLVLPAGGRDLRPAVGSAGDGGDVHPALGWRAGRSRALPLSSALIWSVYCLGCAVTLPFSEKSLSPRWGLEGLNREALSGRFPH